VKFQFFFVSILIFEIPFSFRYFSVLILFQQANAENISPAVAQKLMREVRGLMKDAIEDIEVHLDEENLTSIEADISGPVGTPYAGGTFRARLVFGADFPQAPPKGYFLTKIFHPNVSKTGDICVNTLKRDWTPDLTIKHVLCVIRCLLIEPNAESALNEEAGKLLLENYEDFAKRAAMYTKIHAKSGAADKAVSEKAEAVSASATIVKPKPVAQAPAAAKKSTLKRL
jgi:ubiquitin-conjugating enzyme E2 S